MPETLKISTHSRSEMIDLTVRIQRAVDASGVKNGAAVAYCPHTTAGLTINENADPSVVSDILETLDKLIPWQAGYKHSEGNAAAHVKASLIGESVTVLVQEGRLMLGTWQAIFFCEFDGPRNRQIIVSVK
ncbi:MAG: YjbQ family protein [Vicinamibacteria bacterium]|nr:YjbQ family protein [Vicinamibacteria bacterium]